MAQDIIKVLPDSIANQIAAGEVIESPASLLKELVENAIDAQASQITIEVADAAKSLMRVSDNGIGMSPMDARMAFERHATSKIKSVEDLYTLRTMGFRGEALASIAAVALVELVTRPKESEVGHKIIISGSNVEHSGPEVCEPGSTFTIRNLFFNVPARRRFMQSDKRELNSILREFYRIALVYPQITFKLFSNNTLLHHLPRNTSLGRIEDLFGKKVEKGLIPVKVKSPLVNISGFIGLPQFAKKNGALQYFFVNGRFMKHNYFSKAVMSVYQDIIPTNTQPSYFLYLELDSARIDVNISPTKTSIKFLDDQAIYKLLVSLLRDSISSVNAIPKIDFDSTSSIDIPIYRPQTKPVTPPSVNLDPNYDPFKEVSDWTMTTSQLSSRAWSSLSSRFENQKGENSSSEKNNRLLDKNEFTTVSSSALSNSGNFHSQKVNFVDSKETSELFSASSTSENAHNTATLRSMCYLYREKYLLTTLSTDLALIDIHRASCRILFESIKCTLSKESIPSQRLLFPESVELVTSTTSIETDNMPLLIEQVNSLGFELSPLGINSYSILSVPAIVSAEVASEVIKATIEEFSSSNLSSTTDIRAELIEELSVLLSQKSAIKYGTALTNTESQDLMGSLFACSNSTYDPLGRLIITTIKEEDIAKRFR